MAAVLITAVNFAAIRAASYDGTSESLFLVGILPTADLLAVTLLLIGRRLKYEGRSHAFETGFLALGCLALTAFACSCAVTNFYNARSYLRWVGTIIGPAIDRLRRAGIQLDTWPWGLIEVSLVAFLLGLPQWLLALAGGCLARRLGIKLVVEPRRTVSTRERDRFKALILEEIESGPSTPMTADDWDEIRREVRRRQAERERRIGHKAGTDDHRSSSLDQ